MDDIPDLPEPECGHLVDQFNRILIDIKLLDSVSATSGGGSSGSTPSKGTRTIKRSNTAAISDNNDCSWPQITDEASASVATRVAMILFLLSKNVLGGLSDHTRILRLYPRPVVALQFENFMKSRPRPCLFTSMLAKTQAVEYFAESGIYSQNDAYQRIEAGERSPALIGDKPQWFADLLTPISIDVGPEISSQSRISSDTETESGSTSPISMPSSFISDHLGCDIADPSSELHSDHSFHCDDSYAARSTSSLTQEVQLQSVESAFVRPGVSLPPALASQFHPPTQMVLSAPSLSPQSPDHSETIDLVHSLRKTCPDDDIPLTANQLDNASHKRHSGSPFPTLSTGQTLRTLRRLSLSALSGETPFNGRDDRRPSQMINWNSPLSVLLGSVFNLANPGTDTSTKSVSIVKESKRRIEEERYLDHVAHLIKQGETPGIFSRNYITSLFELESNRNLLLSRLNMTYSDYSAKQLNAHELKDVAIATWNQYKAMVWVLRKISSGIAHSLRPDLVVPTPGAVRADGAHSPTLNPAGGQSRPSGGLASAFCLLEIAHTHYFPLPTRQVQRPQSVAPDFQNEKSSTSLPTAQSTEVRSPVDDRTPDVGGLPSTSGGNSATGYMKFDQNNQYNDLTTESSSKTQAHSSDAGLTDKLSDDSSELQSSGDSSFVRSKAVKIFIDDSIFGEPKSARSRGYCYRQSKLFISPYFSRTVESVSNAVGRSSFGVSTSTQTDRDALTSTSQPGTGARVRRTYLFEDLLTDYNTRSKLWENLQFWEDAFLDAVAQERDMHGMDFHPMELLARYNTSSPLKRKHLEMEEDRLLTGLMHNMIAFMVMVDVDRTDIRRKIRRLLAKSHMGLHHSQEITNLLDVLDFLHGNDVDLKPLQSRSIPSRSYEVYAESDTAGQPLFIEVCEDYLLLRNLLGGILERWWYDQLINLSFRQQTHLLCISVRSNEQSSLNIFYTNKCQTLYQEIRSAMQKTPIKIPHESADLKGEIDVINLDSSCPGTIRLCTDGFSMRFNDQENLIPVPCIKRCSTPQHDLFMIEYFDSHEKRLQTLRLQTDVATNLLYHFHVLIADFSTRLLTSQASRSSRVSSITSKHPSTCSMSCLSDDAN
ncbi:unnamed protein product [Dicrocoelium dendriticum]|nr:unnamed protein product [Dicrocoelium dendriticum]